LRVQGGKIEQDGSAFILEILQSDRKAGWRERGGVRNF
jgi:hypothetical protein